MKIALIRILSVIFIISGILSCKRIDENIKPASVEITPANLKGLLPVATNGNSEQKIKASSTPTGCIGNFTYSFTMYPGSGTTSEELAQFESEFNTAFWQQLHANYPDVTFTLTTPPSTLGIVYTNASHDLGPEIYTIITNCILSTKTQMSWEYPSEDAAIYAMQNSDPVVTYSGTCLAQPSVTPCDGVANINSRAANTTLYSENSSILLNTLISGNEYGVNQNLTSLTSNAFAAMTPTTNGAANAWTPTFSWDSITGYTIGFSHGHPGGTGPSPLDVYALYVPINANLVLLRSSTDRAFYEANASLTTVTANGTYVITISDWVGMNNILTSSYSTPAEENNFITAYQSYTMDYLTNNPGALVGDAGAYALMKLFSGVINVYYAGNGSTSFSALQIQNDGINEADDELLHIDCN